MRDRRLSPLLSHVPSVRRKVDVMIEMRSPGLWLAWYIRTRPKIIFFFSLCIFCVYVFVCVGIHACVLYTCVEVRR